MSHTEDKKRKAEAGESAALKAEAKAKERKRILHLYRQDYSRADIARLLGRGGDYVRDVLRDAGVVPEKPQRKGKTLAQAIACIRARGESP